MFVYQRVSDTWMVECFTQFVNQQTQSDGQVGCASLISVIPVPNFVSYQIFQTWFLNLCVHENDTGNLQSWYLSWYFGFYGNFPLNQPSATKGVGSFEAGLQGASNNLLSSFWYRHFWHRTVFGTNLWHRLRASPRAFPIRRLRTWRQRDLGWILWFYPYTCTCCTCCCCCWWW